LSVTCDRLVVFSTNKTDLLDITEILLKVALNTINQTNLQKLEFATVHLNILIIYQFCRKLFVNPLKITCLYTELTKKKSYQTITHVHAWTKSKVHVVISRKVYCKL
jgi:hypothetical protein